MSDLPNSVELDSPAKINLMLSVHGPQADGFHALTSVVVALNFGDRLRVSIASEQTDVLRCTDPAVPLGMGNLVMQAAARFRESVGRPVYFEFDLEKRIPMGAGLGGGSSNASTALLGMNALLDSVLPKSELMRLAAELGSDCPFFIDPRPSVMHGRGEQIELLEAAAAERLRGQRVVLFRPDFGVETAWAYGQLRANAPESYEAVAEAEARLVDFRTSQNVEALLFNSFEPIVGRKYLALSTLLATLAEKGVKPLMSGSGSCCFAILKETDLSSSQLFEICRNAWGRSVFLVETSVC